MTTFNASAEIVAVSLVKVITVRDDIIIALPPTSNMEVAHSPADAVSVIGRTLVAEGQITGWQFAVRKGRDGALEYAPHQPVSILGHDSLRVEPFNPAIRVVGS